MNHLKKIPLAVLVVFFFFKTYCQENLVPNGGFEIIQLDTDVYSFSNSSQAFKLADTALGWNCLDRRLINVKAAGWTFPDYDWLTNTTYYSDSNYSHFGKMLAIITPHFQSNGYFSVHNIISKLCKPLVKGNNYYIEFYIKLFNSRSYTDQLYVYFFDEFTPTKFSLTDSEIKNSDYQNVTHNPVFHVPVIADSLNYTRVGFLYTATGKEEYLYIGNLNFKQVLSVKKRKPETLITYALDDISVTPSDTLEKCSTKANVKVQATAAQNSQLDVETVLEGVFFEFNKFQLQASYPSLDTLAAYLINSNYKIMLYGYADDVGAKFYNEKISELRAKSVADYLISKGVNKENISYSGKGVLTENINATLKRKVTYTLSKL